MSSGGFPSGFEAVRGHPGLHASLAAAPYPPAAPLLANPGHWPGAAPAAIPSGAIANAPPCAGPAGSPAMWGGMQAFNGMTAMARGLDPATLAPLPGAGQQLAADGTSINGGSVSSTDHASVKRGEVQAEKSLDWPELAGSSNWKLLGGCKSPISIPTANQGMPPVPQSDGMPGPNQAPVHDQARLSESVASGPGLSRAAPELHAGISASASGAPIGPACMGNAMGFNAAAGNMPPHMLQQMAVVNGMTPNQMACAAGQMHAAALQQQAAAMQMGTMWPGQMGGVGMADPWYSMYGMAAGVPNLSALATLPLTGGRQIVPAPKRRSEVRRGAPPNARSRLPTLTSQEVEDKQALIKAANQRDEARCRALLLHPDFAGVNEKDSDGRTVLHCATLRKLPEDLCIEVLKHPGFKDVNAVDRWGNTILTLAASNSLANLCIALLDREDFTAVNVKDKWGATALHWAADRDLGPVCSAILANPAFVEAHTVAFSFCFENRTALQRAEEKGCTDAAEAIRSHLNGTAPVKR